MTYIEELRTAGLPAVSYEEGLRRWGLPHAFLREGAPLDALFRHTHPDLAIVFLDFDQGGKWVAVLETA